MDLSMPLAGLPAFIPEDARLTLSNKKSAHDGYLLVCDGAFQLFVPAIYKPSIIEAYQTEMGRYFAPSSEDEKLFLLTQRTNGKELLDVLWYAEFDLHHKGAPGSNPRHMHVIFEELLKCELLLTPLVHQPHLRILPEDPLPAAPRGRGLDEHGDGTDTVFIYDPEHDSWAPGPTLPFILRGGCAAMHSGELHVMTRSWYPEDRVRFCIYRDGAWLEVPDMVFNSGFGTCQSLVLG